MKAKLEKIEPAFGSSFTIKEFADRSYRNRPSWHVHPEYEIVFISNGSGKRHIGNHVSYYEEGDLIFLGPDLPHYGFTEELEDDHHEIVVQMREDFLGAEFLDKPEMSYIKRLFERARQGISFRGDTKWKVGEQLKQLSRLNGFDRMILLLQILQQLAKSEEYELLQASGFGIEVNAQDHDRIEKVYDYVENHFQREVSLDEVAKKINMTVPAFCRYFKRLTNKTFTQFVNEYRVAHACQLLADESLTISNIGFESGYNNISHFNKQFKNITNTSPGEYRKSLKKIVR